jgi:hypothetical protein
VRFAQAPIPLRLLADAAIGCRVEIAVLRRVDFAKEHRRAFAYRAFMRNAFGSSPRERAQAYLFAEPGSVSTHAIRRLTCSLSKGK